MHFSKVLNWVAVRLHATSGIPSCTAPVFRSPSKPQVLSKPHVHFIHFVMNKENGQDIELRKLLFVSNIGVFTSKVT